MSSCRRVQERGGEGEDLLDQHLDGPNVRHGLKSTAPAPASPHSPCSSRCSCTPPFHLAVYPPLAHHPLLLLLSQPHLGHDVFLPRTSPFQDTRPDYHPSAAMQGGLDQGLADIAAWSYASGIRRRTGSHWGFPVSKDGGSRLNSLKECVECWFTKQSLCGTALSRRQVVRVEVRRWGALAVWARRWAEWVGLED